MNIANKKDKTIINNYKYNDINKVMKYISSWFKSHDINETYDDIVDFDIVDYNDFVGGKINIDDVIKDIVEAYQDKLLFLNDMLKAINYSKSDTTIELPENLLESYFLSKTNNLFSIYDSDIIRDKYPKGFFNAVYNLNLFSKNDNVNTTLLHEYLNKFNGKNHQIEVGFNYVSDNSILLPIKQKTINFEVRTNMDYKNDVISGHNLFRNNGVELMELLKLFDLGGNKYKVKVNNYIKLSYKDGKIYSEIDKRHFNRNFKNNNKHDEIYRSIHEWIKAVKKVDSIIIGKSIIDADTKVIFSGLC